MQYPVLPAKKRPALIGTEHLSLCKTAYDAFGLNWDARRFRYTQRKAAEILGIDKGHFSRILDYTATLQLHNRLPFYELTGNFAMLQFEAKQVGCVLVKHKEYQELKAKERELAELKIKLEQIGMHVEPRISKG